MKNSTVFELFHAKATKSIDSGEKRESAPVKASQAQADLAKPAGAVLEGSNFTKARHAVKFAKTADDRGAGTLLRTDTLSTLPSFLRELVDSCPTAGDGLHRWIYQTARHLLVHFDERSVYELILAKAAGHGRPIGKLEREIIAQIKGAYPQRWQPKKPAAFARAAGVSLEHLRTKPGSPLPNPRPWPEPDLDAINAIVTTGPELYDLWESSPVRFEDDSSHAEEIVDALFPGDPLLCIGESSYSFLTRRREVWRGHLARLPLMVPNPMLDYVGRTADGRSSQHTKQQTARRVYLVVEFDFAEFGRDEKTPSRWASLVRQWRALDKTVADAGAALHLHLASRLPLVCVTHSGGKSLHGWYRAFGTSERQLRRFMDYAVTIGADRATWTRSQFVRIPDGLRENGRRQSAFYFDPAKAIKL